MKSLKPTLAIVLAALALFSCQTRTTEEQEPEMSTGEDIQVYYFHNTLRCATCNAVEDETRMALEMFYGEKLKAGSISFTSLNLEEEEGERLAQTLQVSGQTLLITKGHTRVNLTNEGFMNARTNPTRFHEILKSQIDQLQ